MTRVPLYLAWLLALTSFVISLLSGILYAWPVCDLCWYQRICLYPLAIILGVAVCREDHDILYYVLPLSLLGFFFALYQYLEQMMPGSTQIRLCSPSNGCSTIHFKWLGFITYPFLSMGVAGAISFLVWLNWFKNSRIKTF